MLTQLHNKHLQTLTKENIREEGNKTCITPSRLAVDPRGGLKWETWWTHVTRRHAHSMSEDKWFRCLGATHERKTETQKKDPERKRHLHNQLQHDDTGRVKTSKSSSSTSPYLHHGRKRVNRPATLNRTLQSTALKGSSTGRTPWGPPWGAWSACARGSGRRASQARLLW